MHNSDMYRVLMKGRRVNRQAPDKLKMGMYCLPRPRMVTQGIQSSKLSSSRRHFSRRSIHPTISI